MEEHFIPLKNIQTPNRTIGVYAISNENIDQETVQSFGAEWNAFHGFSEQEVSLLSQEYFDIVTSKMVNSDTIMADFGCGSGRFTKYWQGKAKRIVAIDPSDAVFAADKLIGKDDTIDIVKASIADIPFPDHYFDFGMSIGVLHHIPDTQQAMNSCVQKIKPGGYFYTYLYYNLDNRGWLFRLIWKASNVFRVIIAALPQKLKVIVCDLLAFVVYVPLVGLVRFLKLVGLPKSFWSKIPLSAYENKSLFIIRNDALDRFGTPLEQRFSKKEIEAMMTNAGLVNIVFSDCVPYWHAVGQKANP